MSSRLWHPFADMAVVKDAEVVIARGEGALVWDERGREYVDALAGLWYCSIGHGRSELADAGARQLKRLAGYNIFDRLANRPALDLAERVGALAPFSDAAVFFTSGGSEAVDTAAKLARRYWHAVGRPQKQVIIHREHAYHGMNAYGTSLAGIPINREGFGTMIEAVASVPFDDASALERLLRERSATVAALIGEPVIGAGGILHPPPGYWPAVQRLCAQHEVLLIADEVITGFGRLGTWFGAERLGIDADLITCAKGISSGYQPLGAVIASPRVQEPFFSTPGSAVFRHGYTYSGHPVACAVALANIAIIERERLLEGVLELEGVLARAVAPLAGHELVSEVRAGLGLLAAVELEPAVREADPTLLERTVAACRERGVLTRGLAGRALQISPSFVIGADQIATIAKVIDDALTAVAATLG